MITLYKIFDKTFLLKPYNNSINNHLFNYFHDDLNYFYSLKTIKCKNIIEPTGTLLYDGSTIKWIQTDEFSFIVYKKNKSISHAIKYSKDWNNVELLIKDSMSFEQEYYLYGVIFAFIALRHNGINLHGSAISYKDQGIIFSGPSGAGKSTQSHLWQSVFNQDVDILNDDKPIIDMNKDVPDVYGTPFAGSSKLNTNKHVPLKGIVIVEKAPYNKVAKTKRSEAYLHLLRESTRPEYSKREMEHFLKLLEDLLNKIPIYTLYCRKEEDAVYTLHKTLFEGDYCE